MMITELTHTVVWETLSKVDVNERKKSLPQGGRSLDYLPWSAAWMILLENFPMANYEFHPEEHLENGTVMTFCTVSIGPVSRTMHLPVMDYKNNSVVNPSSRQISDCRMRCLTKCIAMHGLGFYVYQGVDLPYQNEELPNEEVDQTEANALYAFTFIKTGGDIVGANTHVDYFNLIKRELNNPKNVVHQNTFKRNVDEINKAHAASEGAEDGYADRFKNLKALYPQEEVKDGS